ncbi:MAG: DUF5320 domain-containing protein [Planctomycetes bacterium]|nr:DUF5320 domain-containing protein [Planctomycetota bacterium]
MPHGDGTGPLGQGVMTGRGAGYCAGFSMPGYMNPMPGRGWGMGRGWGRGRGMGQGRGWRHGYYPMGLPATPSVYGVAPGYPPFPAEQEVQALKAQAEHFEGTLGAIRERIAQIEAAQEKEG